MKLSSIRLGLALLMLNSTLPAGQAVKKADSRTIYEVSIEARNVPYELFVNDIPVIDKKDEASSINSNISINPWLINGRNTFRIRIPPVKVSTADPMDPKFCKVVVSGPKDAECRPRHSPRPR